MDDWRVLLAVLFLAGALMAGLNMARQQGERALLHREQVLATRASVAIARAQPPNVPAHYAPHIQLTQAPERAALPGPAGGLASMPVPPAFQPDSLGVLALRGLFRSGQYLYGFTPDGQPVQLPQDEGRSLGIFGQGGSGGTTALLAAALQELLVPFYLPGQQEPARLIVIDYHARKPQSLTQRILGTPLESRLLLHAHTPREVEQALLRFERENKARVEGAPTPWPCILVCDEIGNMVDDADYADIIPLALATFRHANNAYRAIGGKACVRAHTVSRVAWGNDATVRQSFHVRIGMRLDESAGRLLGLRPAVAQNLMALPRGQGYVAGPGLPLTQIITPLVETEDVQVACDLAEAQAKGRTVFPVSASRASVADQSRASRGAVAPPGDDAAVAGVDQPDATSATEDREAQYAVDLFYAGQDMIAAIEQAFGVNRNNPNRFNMARKRYEAAMRRLTQKGA
jgi:hypothetical protein